MPVTIPGHEVHGLEVTARAQCLVHQTDAFEEVGPVEGRHQTHAGDDVPHGDVHRPLVLVLAADELVGRGLTRREPFIQPCERRRQLGVLIPQPLDELYRERGGQAPSPETSEGGGLGRVAVDAEELIGQRIRLLAAGPALHDVLRQAPEILEQYHAQADGNGPQLADGQRLHSLEGGDEAAKGRGIEVAVGMRDERPRQREHARMAREGALGQLGKLAVEALRQVVAHVPEPLVDDVKVVDEPFRGGSDRALVADDLGDRAVAAEEDPPVVSQPRRQGGGVRGGCGGALRREALGVLLEALGAQELVADRRVRLGPWCDGASARRDGPEPRQAQSAIWFAADHGVTPEEPRPQEAQTPGSFAAPSADGRHPGRAPGKGSRS